MASLTLSVHSVGYRPGRPCTTIVEAKNGDRLILSTPRNMLDLSTTIAILRSLTATFRYLDSYIKLNDLPITIEISDLPTYWLLIGARTPANTGEKKAAQKFRAACTYTKLTFECKFNSTILEDLEKFPLITPNWIQSESETNKIEHS